MIPCNFIVTLSIFFIFLYSCSSVRIIKPLNKGEKRAFADIGGPLVQFNNIPIFLPLSSVGYAYGMNQKFSVITGIHTTSLLFGTLQTELFSNIRIKEFKNTGISANVGGYYFLGLREYKSSLYPMFDFNFYWNYSNKPRYLYVSCTNLFELHHSKAFGEPIAQRLIPTLSVGHRWEKEKHEWGIELKYINFVKDNRNIVVEYISPTHYGTLGLTFSFTKKF